MLPIDQLQLLQLAAVMTNGDYIGFETLGERLVGDAPGMLDDETEQLEYLLVVRLVEVEAQLLATLLLLILFLCTLASRPQLVSFFSRGADQRCHLLDAHRNVEKRMGGDKII